jgi:hypothetical protein
MRTFRALSSRVSRVSAIVAVAVVANASPVLAQPRPVIDGGTRPQTPGPAPAAAKAVIDLDEDAPKPASKRSPAKSAGPRPAMRATPANAAHAAKTVEPELPSLETRMWLIAPTPTGAWTLRVDNEGTRPIRIPADIRLLHFEVDPTTTFVAPAVGRAGHVRAAKPKAASGAKKLACAVPSAMRPEGFPDRSALILKPGESYVESFDPRLFCFGKDAASLTGSAVVRPRFGWEPPAKTAKTAPTPPFAAEGVDFPAQVAPLRSLFAPTLVLSYDKPAPDPGTSSAPAVAPPPAAPARTAKDDDADSDDSGDDDDNPPPPKPSFDAKVPIVDENAARLELSVDAYVDALDAGHVPITVSVKNVGHRAAAFAYRSRMLAFHVEGPDGAFHCDAAAGQDAIARDNFPSIAPGAKLSLTVLLGELCPTSSFRRPGLYKVTPTVFANEPGAVLRLDAYTGVIRTKESALVRIQTGPEPFYTRSARPRPTPTPASEP